MAGGGDHDLALEHVGVHAHLCVVVEGDQRPVGDGAAHVLAAKLVLAHHQVLNSRRVEQLDVGRLQPERRFC